ncbi:hypothetical protein BVIR_1052 [Blastochloris viridis]|uniref:Uncharacterized protein n=1 Tax=Blastochloris viridis TaxID=1079 RepID=A0A0P0JF20_BLAVI|nr:hypothetical protein BVIR_1052 [Blastochloris viridis]CUU41502.1 hypothetical protein BVIRIDIS_04950 [Blastochloris viridis]
MPFAATPAAAHSRKPRGSWVPFPRIASRCSPGTTGRGSRGNLSASSSGEPSAQTSTCHPRAREPQPVILGRGFAETRGSTIRDLMPFAATPAAAHSPQASRIMGPLPSHRFSRCSPGTTGRASRTTSARRPRASPAHHPRVIPERGNLNPSSSGEGTPTRHPRARLCRDPRIHDPRPDAHRRDAGRCAFPQASRIMGPLSSHRFAMLAGDDRSRFARQPQGRRALSRAAGCRAPPGRAVSAAPGSR